MLFSIICMNDKRKKEKKNKRGEYREKQSNNVSVNGTAVRINRDHIRKNVTYHHLDIDEKIV